MLELLFQRDVGKSPRLLFLGAHSDDIEIGSGGTALTLLERFPDASVVWVVFSAAPQRAREAETSAARFLAGVRDKRVMVKEFRENYFPFVGEEIKKAFGDLTHQIEPDLVFTHFREDLHQDHRLISELTWNTFRSSTILEYEIPKYDGDLGRPNLYVPLSKAICEEKVQYIMEGFPSQTTAYWFTKETFLSLLRLRGVEARETYAEAFHARKLVIDRPT